MKENYTLPSQYFGSLVFDRPKMKKYLDSDTYNALVECIEQGARLERSIADKVAAGMKSWALDNGVTHISHWFQPLTDVTAEKHDSMLEYDGNGGMIESFDGKSLAQQEPDASSFPSGGLRSTFEARGYTAWDPTSPVFIHDGALCIPTVFIAYTGEALDYKTPLKRSIKAINEAALPICRMFDPKVNKVNAYLGWEQEYFLIDNDLFTRRPDLQMTGRTLMGHQSSKNQQLDDHYFGAMPERVSKFALDVERQAYELGIPMKTSHKEAAPNQFEMAPIYAEMNLANDQNQLVMNIMSSTAKKYGFVLLLHEKPFAGVNGSGKHCNWSLGTDTGVNLTAPGKNPSGNLQFLTFFVCTLAAVQRHNAVLKASIASATNAHRLGAAEAPPAIVSAFIGKAMNDVLEKLLVLPSDTPIEIAGKSGKKLAMVEIPEIFLDNTDRNRTSPFAFTGNRFEFRAVGASANCAGSMTTLNAAVAETLLEFKSAVDSQMASGKSLNVAIMETLKPMIASILGKICFAGNGYSEEWVKEAARRGLDTEKRVPEMFKAFTSESSVKLFTGTKVYSITELEARNEVKWETFCKKVEIETRVMVRVITNHIIPAALKYKAELAASVRDILEIYASEARESKEKSEIEFHIIDCITKLSLGLHTQCAEIMEARKNANSIDDIYLKAMAYNDISERLIEMRQMVDKLEEIVDNDKWPLPKYRQLLFINS